MAVKYLLRLLFFSFYFFDLHTNFTRSLPMVAVKRNINALPGIEVPPPEILRFMRRFGYLDPNPSDSEALYHESAIVEAVKNIQKYGAINQTGKLDNETLNLLTKPRCGVPDIEATPYYLLSSTQTPNGRRNRLKRYVLGARTWTKRHLKYYIANWSLKIPRFQVERDIARSVELWSQYSGLKFERVNDTAADIIVGFGSQQHGDNFPFDGPGNILAHAFYPYEMGSWGGDVHFDEDENWKENSTDLANGVDFFSVAAHEIGHSLGLAHSPVYTSIMFPYYKGPAQSTLDYGDTLAMYEMYLSKRLEGDEDMDNSAGTDSTTTTALSTIDSRSDISTKCYGNCVTVQVQEAEQETQTNSVSLSSTDTPNSRDLAGIPNICTGHFDAVAVINGSLHIFKRQYVWKLTNRFTVVHGFPRTIWDMFPFLPDEVKRIDAAYCRYDGATVFFIGKSVWIFRDLTTIESSPKQLSELIGAEYNIANVDAVMMWPKNNFTYIFAGSLFWRYNDKLQTLDAGYTKSMHRWPGIPNILNAATTLPNGKTYFFKDNIYWLYNNIQVRPERGYPRRASTAWLGCPVPTKTPLRNFNTTISFISFFSSPSA